ncbi:cytochrome c oxidase assembly protein [Alcanivorax balearicus MACL04]|uniref:Cytochrome c oxidase assembly protein n=1 Tax=Alloalcanivorax balearicus MACL04 TaxID=1177182 RepID=A0ABT2QUV9_9GAMM|nr:COX15/CtaA family protein [Alloalcanivorax balearicus]MCU5781305.1 cytochrome c oxidase assembly protein [Alloalcanivorax balearicus MACL04]
MQTLTFSQIWLRRMTIVAIVLAAGVIALGAWTRLSDAGLGCPDWPGCYGHLDVRKAVAHVSDVNSTAPGALREAHKTIPEMVHRYFASVLGLTILIIAALSWINRKRAKQPLKLPLFLVVLVIFQGLLGMWTVTMGLQPTIVMLHLLGGFTTLTLLSLLAARLYRWPEFLNDCDVRTLKPLAGLALAAVILQIALGGWTTANYAAVVCTELPVCESGWTDHLNFADAFIFWGHEHDLPDYEFGVLENDARTTIHVMHRFGALLVSLLVLTLVARILRRAHSTFFRNFAGVILLLLLVQVGLGIGNVVFSVPLKIAVAHNFGAVVLLITLVLFIRAINVKCTSARPGPNGE